MANKLPAYFQRKIEMSKLFGKPMEAPNKENAMKWLDRIECELSPENLTCDGELSRKAVAQKTKMLNDAWSYVEGILGRKVSGNEVYEWSRKQRGF